MPRPFPIVFAALALLGAGHPALAEEGLAKRGTTYTTDGDVSQYRQQPNRSRSQIFILRGSEAKASQKDPCVLVRLALWEAGAEDTAPAERALAQAMVARRAARSPGVRYRVRDRSAGLRPQGPRQRAILSAA